VKKRSITLILPLGEGLTKKFTATVTRRHRDRFSISLPAELKAGLLGPVDAQVEFCPDGGYVIHLDHRLDEDARRRWRGEAVAQQLKKRLR
jgi:hypothetical protein